MKGIVPFILLRAGRCDEALDQFQKIHHEYPPYIPAANNIGVALICKGLYREAAAEFEKTVPLQDAPERASFAVLAFAYAKSGRREKAQEMLRTLQEESSRRHIDPVNFAIIHAGLGDNDRAFDSLGKAYKDRSGPPFVHLQSIAPIALETLRSDPRWPDFARRKGLAY